MPSSGGVSRVAKGADCKSAASWLRRFESFLPHQPLPPLGPRRGQGSPYRKSQASGGGKRSRHQLTCRNSLVHRCSPKSGPGQVGRCPSRVSEYEHPENEPAAHHPWTGPDGCRSAARSMAGRASRVEDRAGAFADAGAADLVDPTWRAQRAQGLDQGGVRIGRAVRRMQIRR